MIFEFAFVTALLGAGASFQSSNQASEALAVLPDPSAEAVRVILDDTLVNYPETRLRNVRLVLTGFSGGPKTVKGFCGEMNTQNRMSGYTGWSAFFVSDIPIQERAPDRLYVAGMRGTMDEYMPGFTTTLVNTFCGGSEERLDNRDYTDALAYRSAD